jgi:hypothetical protein
MKTFSNLHGISPSCLIQVVLMIRSSIWIVSLLHKVKKAQTSSDEATEHIERHLRLKMALVHPNSCECTKSELDLLGVPPTQTSVEHGYWEQKGLTSTLTDLVRN